MVTPAAEEGEEKEATLERDYPLTNKPHSKGIYGVSFYGVMSYGINQFIYNTGSVVLGRNLLI